MHGLLARMYQPLIAEAKAVLRQTMAESACDTEPGTGRNTGCDEPKSPVDQL
jgi:hypothetical protein